MLIKTYGEFWNPYLVDWSGGRLDGIAKLKVIRKGVPKKVLHTIDFWDAQGIYVLLNDFKPVYVGQSIKLGKRIGDHLTDRFAGRWDMFSWYSVCNPNISKKSTSLPGNRMASMNTVIDTLEALGILIADPALNRKREKLPNAIEFEQKPSSNPKSVREYLDQILVRLGH